MDDAVQELLAWKGIAAGAWLVGLVLLERLLPKAEAPAGDGRFGHRRVLRNGALWLANTILSPLAVVPVSLWAAAHGLGWRPDWWSGWVGLAVDLVLLDGLIYWWHRANHEIPFLWRFHEIHHLDRFLDATSAVRFHFGEVLLSAAARAVIIILLDVPISSVIAFETLLLAATIFHHSNLRLPDGLERALARIVVTPSIHWVHHHRVRRDTDSNYATILSLWDRLFASRSATRRWTTMPIGVEGEDERPIAALFARPFRRRVK